MNDLHLLLDSRLVKMQPGRGDQLTHDFKIYFPECIFLDPNRQYRAAPKKLITMTYSWHNVVERYSNNQLRWQKKGEAWKTLTFPDGMYDYTNLTSFLQAHMGYVDLDATDKKSIFSLYFDLSIYRMMLGIAKDYELYLYVGEFADLLGFDKKIFLQAHMGYVDLDATDKKSIFSLYFDLSIYWMMLGIAKDYELYLYVGEFADLLGFDKKILKLPEKFLENFLEKVYANASFE